MSAGTVVFIILAKFLAVLLIVITYNALWP